MAAKLAERKKATAKKELKSEDYEAEIDDIVKELTAAPPIETAKLADVLNGFPGMRKLRVKDGDTCIAEFMLFARGSLTFGHLKIPPTSNMPGPSLFGICVYNHQMAVILDIGLQRIATLSEIGENLTCGITSFKYITGVRELFNNAPEDSIKLTAIKLLSSVQKLIVCFIQTNARCKECAIFNAFELDLSENKLKFKDGQYPANNYIKNVLVGSNVITSICELGYVTNLWDQSRCKHFPKNVDWGQLNQGKFVDSYSRFVILESTDTPRVFELYESGKPLLTFKADQTFFDNYGYIWLKIGNVATRAGITDSRQIMIIEEYHNCGQLLKIGGRLSIRPEGDDPEALIFNDKVAARNYEEYKKIAYLF